MLPTCQSPATRFNSISNIEVQVGSRRAQAEFCRGGSYLCRYPSSRKGVKFGIRSFSSLEERPGWVLMAVHVDLHLCVAHVPAPLAARSPAQSCSVRNVRKYVKKQIRPIRWRPKRLFLAVFGCFWAVLGCSGLFWAVSRCFCCFRCCIAVVRLFPVVHGGFGLLGAVGGCFRPFPAVSGLEKG
jgi:hypothetical protein